MSAMADMSRAIRLTMLEHGATLQTLPDEVLRDYADIVWAFALDLQDEVSRRKGEADLDDEGTRL